MAIAAGNTEMRGHDMQVKYNAIRRVDIAEPPYRYYGDYSERPTRYMITLNNETRPRRVYATPFGNAAAIYLKSHGHEIYCETALDYALHRNEGQ